MMSVLVEECGTDNFCADNLVDRLAWRTLSSHKDDRFDANSLKKAFSEEIQQLQIEYDNLETRCQRLEEDCGAEMGSHQSRIGELIEKSVQSRRTYKNLSAIIGRVAAKVVHLGDFLDSASSPRARLEEVEKLMLKFVDFLGEVSDIPLSEDNIYEHSDLMQKLYLIAQELPPGSKFEEIKARITVRYSQIEGDLIDEFRNAHEMDNADKMRKLASILVHFTGFQKCVDMFITDVQRDAFAGSEMFDEVVTLCRRTQEIVTQVFANPKQIMAKFITNVYTGQLCDYIASELQVSERGDYLHTLLQMYSKTEQLPEELTQFKIDYALLQKLSRQIFQKDLDGYMNVEMQYLRERLDQLLKRYYEDLGHVKRPAGALQDLRRDMQAFIKPLANIKIAPVAEDFGGETFLSETLAANMLLELTLSLHRCRHLSRQSDRAKNACQIWRCLQSCLCVEYIGYGLDIGLRCIPVSETKKEPRLTFLECARDCNTIVHLTNDLFHNSVVPLISSSPEYGLVLQTNRECTEQMELKIQQGVELCLQAMMGWIRKLLNKQRRSLMGRTEIGSSSVCARVCRYANKCTSHIQQNLDGQNCTAVLTEFGVQFHRAIYEHTLSMQYDEETAEIIMCDVNEYRACTRKLPPFIDRLFEVFSALVNLLMTPQNKLQDLLTSHTLKQLDPQVLQSFIKLRTEWKDEQPNIDLLRGGNDRVQVYFKARKESKTKEK